MSRTFKLALDKLLPERQAVLGEQGIPSGAKVPDQVSTLYDDALEIFKATGQPAGITARVTRVDFDRIFPGTGANDAEAPLAKIYPRAHTLALFALTLGRPVSSKIEGLFAENDFALATMLDSIASLAADRAVERLERDFARELADQGHPAPMHVSLGYSPGYCGWHISGQKRLFDALHPKDIGITLNDSYLMAPLKSISGILVEGPGGIHQFEPNFTFCRTCRTHSCVPRMRPARKA